MSLYKYNTAASKVTEGEIAFLTTLIYAIDMIIRTFIPH